MSYRPCGLVVHNRVPTGKLPKKQTRYELLLSKYIKTSLVSVVLAVRKWTQMRPNEGKKPSEACQYILIFCFAEKHRLDTLSHCLENNFPPFQSDIQASHASQIKARKLNTLKRRFQADGGWILPPKTQQKMIEGGKNHHCKKLVNKHLKILPHVKLECKAEVKFLTECQYCRAKHQSLPVGIRIQPTTPE